MSAASLIAEVRELVEHATAGPWRPGRVDMTSIDEDGTRFKNVYADDKRGGHHHVTGEKLPYCVARGEGDECHANARLIARARTLIVELADELERRERADNNRELGT